MSNRGQRRRASEEEDEEEEEEEDAAGPLLATARPVVRSSEVRRASGEVLQLDNDEIQRALNHVATFGLEAQGKLVSGKL